MTPIDVNYSLMFDPNHDKGPTPLTQVEFYLRQG